jgi:CBS domain-containing protein
MNVETILRTKGRDVATIGPEATIGEAVQRLGARGIGALVVVSADGVQVEGILSERDIVLGLADRGAALLAERVGDRMTRRVHTCTPEDAVEDLMGMMTQKRIRHLPVLKDGALCGIVSIGDVVKNRLDEIEFEASSLRSMIAG